MQRIRMVWVLAAVMSFAVLLTQSRASAGLSIVSQSVGTDSADKEALFSLTFNQTPNFVTVDSLGRPQDAFQYEIVPNVSDSIDNYPFSSIQAVFRGSEIGSGSVIPIRAGFANGSDPSPQSGGWGVVIGKVPFSLTGHTLSFDVPWSLMGSTNGVFTYRLFTTNYGTTVSTVEGNSIVPLPTAWTLGLVGLAALGFGRWLVRFRSV